MSDFNRQRGAEYAALSLKSMARVVSLALALTPVALHADEPPEYEGVYLAMTDGSYVELQKRFEDTVRYVGFPGWDMETYCGFNRKGSYAYAHQITQKAWNDAPTVAQGEVTGVYVNSRTEEFVGILWFDKVNSVLAPLETTAPGNVPKLAMNFGPAHDCSAGGPEWVDSYSGLFPVELMNPISGWWADSDSFRVRNISQFARQFDITDKDLPEIFAQKKLNTFIFETPAKVQANGWGKVDFPVQSMTFCAETCMTRFWAILTRDGLYLVNIAP